MISVFIPPVPLLGEDFFGYGQMHLLLSHLSHIPDYQKHYVRQKKLGSYLILDNSAHEFQTGATGKSLLEQAVVFDADEIVLPDHLFDGGDTLYRSVAALRYILNDGRREYEKLEKPNFMMVPQGRSVEEWAKCLNDLLDMYHRMARWHSGDLERRPVIGLSKDYEIFDGGLYRLIEEYLYPKVVTDEIQVHCLGWGRDLWALNRIGRHFPKLRSVDSAKPFVYAMSDIQLIPGQEFKYPGRPEDYFGMGLTPKQKVIARRNGLIFSSAAEGLLNGL